MAGTPNDSADSDTPVAVGASTYDLLRKRLSNAAKDVETLAEQLNTARLEAFGSSKLELVGSERVRTENNVVPRDVAVVEGQMVLAYNAVAGLRNEIRPEDVFSVHQLGETQATKESQQSLLLSPNAKGLAGTGLDSSGFRHDFKELHTYFQNARLQQLYRSGEYLLAVFRTGDGISDLRVLRWQIFPDGRIEYLDDKGEREHQFPTNQDVDWVSASRADQVENSHYEINSNIMVNPLGGTINLTLSDGTETGLALLSEPVEQPDQALQDCELDYAIAGDLVLLRVRPYREPTVRHYVVNLLTRTASRLDALGQAFRQLPEGQGLIFPEGIYLRTGEVRTFDLDAAQMELLEVVRSPNGEDTLYVFHHKQDGRSILLPYNVVRQEVATPIWCHGYCLFDDGQMIIFREEAEPTRVHPMQIWLTPFCSDDWHADQPTKATPLDRIGNANLVTGIADALALTRLVDGLEPSAEVYGDLIGSAGSILDNHHWLTDDDVGNIAKPVNEIRAIAEQVIDEFEQVQEIRKSAQTALDECETQLNTAVNDLRIRPPASTEQFIDRLATFRQTIGHLHTSKEVREIDVERLDELIAKAQQTRGELAKSAASHLAKDDAFVTYTAQLVEVEKSLPSINSSIQARKALAQVDETAQAMDLVASSVSDLVVEDPTVRTKVLEQVSGVLASVNRVRAQSETKLLELTESETGAAFSTELGLFGQSIATALTRCDTATACDEALTRLMLQLEQLETGGPRTDVQLDQIAKRRDQITETFTGRRQQLLDEAQQHSDRLLKAAARTLSGIADRTNALDSADDINGFFAADPMIERVRKIVDDLKTSAEPVKADELASELSNARDTALRSLKDRQELFDGDAVKLGQHRFSVDDRKRFLTIVPNEDHLEAVLTGTDLRVTIDDPTLTDHKDKWSQPLPSETSKMYRSTFLAGDFILSGLAQLGTAESTANQESELELLRALKSDPKASDRLLEAVQAEAASRLDESYDRGVHDIDAHAIICEVGPKALAAGPLIFTGTDRAEAIWAWTQNFDDASRQLWIQRGQASAILGATGFNADTVTELRDVLNISDSQASYLQAELVTQDVFSFAQSNEVEQLANELSKTSEVNEAVELLNKDAKGAFGVLHQHISSQLEQTIHGPARKHIVNELAVILLTENATDRRVIKTSLEFSVAGLLGRHPTISRGELTSRVDIVLDQVKQYKTVALSQYRELNVARTKVLAELETKLRLKDLEPDVPEGFVRNKLIDQVYLPLIGDNLSRQIGTADNATSERNGLLLLLSPPGYGKTTLVEYLANRLGMALVKVSGPSLGHDVTTLDPAQAKSATAAREVELINLSFAIGSNVMLYVDDIQHTSPEFLQRFISLCDGQRQVEGVWDGQPQSFDMRGKRFAVVMAGNPYTESGQRFQIPDMLANRADTYNLGDVLAGSEDLFASSYIENCLRANPVLAPLAGASNDLAIFSKAASGQPLAEADLQSTYSTGEATEIVSVLKHLTRVQEAVLAVNRQYIASAATEDIYRTEPPFLLQGSYRNMTRMASKLLPVMTSDEVDKIIDEHYVAESQALTGAAEANLLKLAELRGVLTADQQQRWDEIVKTFARKQLLGGGDEDPATRVVAAISGISTELASIRLGDDA